MHPCSIVPDRRKLILQPHATRFRLTLDHVRAKRGVASGGSSNITYGNSVNLRGIGPYATLVLVNGHRVVGNTRSVDPSIIPTLGLERVEVVADGASAIYGSDAVAGVVNLIPRRTLNGVEATARYGTADDFDQWQMGVAIGRATGGTTVSATVDFLSVARPLLAPVLLALGLGLRLLIGATRNLSDAGRSRRLLWQVTPLWERLLADRPELSIEAPMSRVAVCFGGSHAQHLHRRYVEVRDCLLLHPDQSLSAREATLIERIEEHIRQASHASSGTTNDSRTNEHEDAR